MKAAEEIRIGNYYDHNGEFKKVTPDTILNLWEAERTWIKSIPLTEEWLKRFGFDEFQYGWYQIEKSPLKITWNIYDKNIRAFGYNLTNVCQYIHQLQNLYFALTGEELKEI
jgi:hypothetical protein